MTEKVTAGIHPPKALGNTGLMSFRRWLRPGLAGKLAVAALLCISAVAGLFLWYVVNYGHYEAGDFSDATGLEQLAITEFKAIKGSASPLKFKACFVVSAEQSVISSKYSSYENPVPLVAPSWFECFDAENIGLALESGEARAYLASESILDGIDRVAAIFSDGRGYAWHQLNSEYRQ